MQCMHMNEIITVDKKAIKMDMNFFQTSKDPYIRSIYKGITSQKIGWDRGIEEYFKGKEWVFFNQWPNALRSKERKQYTLWKAGFMKTNKVPCGCCEICKVEKSKTWAVKAAAERKVWENACFLTLTYKPDDPVFVATEGTINKATMQAFWKKLRYHLYKETKEALEIDLKTELELMQELPDEIKLKYLISRRKPKIKPIRYIQANEYGEKKGRCHHHAIVFNFWPIDAIKWKKDKRGYWLYRSPKIEKIWGHGRVIIGRATTNAAAYVGRYCTKKHSKISNFINNTINQINNAKKQTDSEESKEILDETLKIYKGKKESISASSLGYIGSYYWETHKDEVKRNMGILVQWAKGVHLEKIPKPMEKQWEDEEPDTYEYYEFEKERIGKEQWEEILSKTDMSEEEYIKSTYENRMRKIEKLKREYDEKPLETIS